MKKFKVNEYITFKLENDETVIYVAGERFQQCRYLLFDIPVDNISIFDDLLEETADQD